MRLALLLTIAATSANADYSGHPFVQLFTERPCTEAVAAIDQRPPTENIDAMVLAIAEQGAAWGFLLGFDQARGGLHDGSATTLERLRKACAEAPGRPAAELLDGLK